MNNTISLNDTKLTAVTMRWLIDNDCIPSNYRFDAVTPPEIGEAESARFVLFCNLLGKVCPRHTDSSEFECPVGIGLERLRAPIML